MFIKEHAHFSRSIGGVFFVLCFIIGILWVVGCDVEPVAYVLGLISSAFLGLPSLAQYILPDRKPVRDMSARELIDFVAGSSKENWKRFENTWAWEAYLDEDPRLRLICRFDEYGKHCDDFSECWATKVSNGPVQSYYYDLMYDRALIERFILVSIDGNRASIPLPKSAEELCITALQYKIGEIVNRETANFHEYLNRTEVQTEST